MKCRNCDIECKNSFCSNSCKCKDYYKRKREVQKSRKLDYYYQLKQNNYERLREINQKAALKYKHKVRFSGNYEFIHEKYNHKCAKCLGGKLLSIHHIDGVSYWNSKNPNNSLDNLILLCASCHHKLHHEQRRRYSPTLQETVRSVQ